MAKKKRTPHERNEGLTPAVKSSQQEHPGGSSKSDQIDRTGLLKRAATPPVLQALPAEIARGDWTIIIFALMMFFAPALGVPHEEMLQDTLKSIVIAFGALSAALAFFWQQRNRRDALRWHGLMWLPLALFVYALGSMVWSHTYLGGVEAVRWFVFCVIVWLTINTASREKFPLLASGIHAGAFVATLWGLLQFLIDFRYFPQGPNPASTFVNRNFFAEFIVCTLPFSFYLLASARKYSSIFLVSLTTGVNIAVLMMTGTRSALLALMLLAFVLPVIAYRIRKSLAFRSWDSGKRIIAMGVLVATIVGLGLVNTGNEKIRNEGRGINGLQTAFARAKTMTTKEEYTVHSFSVRLIMWKATVRMIASRPFSGVGAGAWESDIPLYQREGAQLETDYYVHNEILQLIAEYGVAGWLFLLLLLSYLTLATWRTLKLTSGPSNEEATIRAVALAALLAFLVVSNAGFPWRMASTGALFALCLGLIAASDARLGFKHALLASRLQWSPAKSQVLAVLSMISLALAAYITQQAAECEFKIVRATKLALTITASGDFNNPKWDKSKAEMLKLIKEGTDINPHYRKITPMVADELAKWGDWKNATWVWETVISSRPYVVAIMANVARGYATMGNVEKALSYLERAKAIQPRAPSVRSLEVVLLSRSGKEAKALTLAKDAIATEAYDFDLVNAAFILAWRANDYPFALQAMDLRMKGWPANKVAGLLQLGNMYTTGLHDQAKGLETFKAAMDATPAEQRQSLLPQIPPVYWPKLGFGHITPVMPNQTSSTKK